MSLISYRTSRCWVLAFLTIFSFLIAGCANNPKRLGNGIDYASAGDWDKSVQFYQKAYQQHPDDPEIKLMLTKSKWNASLAHMAKGEALLKERNYDEAIAEFQMSLAFYSSNDRAAKLIEEAKATRESNYYTRRGQNYLRAEKYSQARGAFERAINLNPHNQDARKALSRIKEKESQAPKFRLKLRSNAPISLKFKGTPVVNVFEALTKITGVNFIFDKDMVDSKTTMFMTDVSFDRFLEVLLKTNNLAAKLVDEHTMIIYPNTPAKAKEYDDLQIRTFYLANMDVKKAVAMLAKILRSKDIMANEALNAVVIRGPKQLIDVASRVIEANDRAPAEVVLNVEILEVSRNKEKNLGLEINPPSVTFGIGPAASEVNKDSSFAGMASMHALGSLASKELMMTLPQATLNLLKQDADTTTLANPQIRVKDGEKATIHIGERVPLRVNRRIDTTGAVTSDYIYQDIGVQLQAEPSINLHGDVTLKLFLEVSALGPNLGTTDEPQYAIKARRATSVLMVRDGEPVIMGGLISDEERDTTKKIPLLGDIPAVGRLFSNKNNSATKTDILMAITPVLTRAEEVPGADVSTIWSGSENDFSLREPYESYAERKDPAGKKQENAFVEKGQVPDKPKDNPGAEKPAKPDSDIQEAPPSPSQGRAVVEGGKGQGLPMPMGDGKRRPPAIDPMTQMNLSQPSSQNGAFPMARSPRNASPGMTGEGGPKPKGEAPKAGEPEIDKGDAPAAGDGGSKWPAAEPYSVHVNSYPKQQMAEERVTELNRMNYDSFMVPADIPDRGTWYRVFVGKFKDRASAESLCKSLKEKKEFASDIHVADRQWGLGG